MKTRKSGFTLVEILIVVIILGILAAIIIPQFTDASTSAKESSLTSNLQTLRSQIGLYKIQHGDEYPGGPGNTDVDVFTTCLTTVTNEIHEEWADGDGTKCGPYMPNVPENPFITVEDTPLFTIDNTADGVPAGNNDSHWYFNSVTGAIAPNDDKVTADGTDTPHTDL